MDQLLKEEMDINLGILKEKKYTEEDFNKKIEELSKPEIKVYINKDYISSLEDWDERFNNNFTRKIHYD
jgi:SepF-like predicted cell division protein (DUF552 family)